ncbi:RNA exonuclease 5-like [Phlebotomus papatasi]|uniref:RNA exonuclease 5-like n=1 Tax=Phlebotomus papatasi TaxID=29031 RepID=UPI0024834AF9|nr:RNA exonuclease 5-like [Phlebotomus papatasi]
MTPGPPASSFREKSSAVSKKNLINSDGETNHSPSKKVKLNEKSIALRRAKELRKREKKKAPKVKLNKIGEESVLTVCAKERKSIIYEDLRHLLSSSLLGKLSPDPNPRWCNLEKMEKISQTVVLIVEGLTLGHFSKHRQSFPLCKEIFLSRIDTLMPNCGHGQVFQELVEIPISDGKKKELLEQHGSLGKALEVESFLIEEERAEIYNSREVKDNFSRVKLLLSPLQMIDSKFPLPFKGAAYTKNYVFTKDTYAPVTSKSPMFALDCEMVMTSSGVTEVFRLSIVNEDCESVYETFIRPQRSGIDYETGFSGATADLIKFASKSLKEVQNDVRKLLSPDAILVGHSLDVDLEGLSMIHPYVIDTSIIYNVRGDNKRTRLQELAKMHLGETIQSNSLGHDSIEDSITSMKLVKLKLSKGLQYGDVLLGKLQDTGFDINSLGGLIPVTDDKIISENLFGHLLAKKSNAKVSIVASENTALNYEKFIPKQWRGNERISISIRKNNKAAIVKSCKSLPDATFSITHLALDDNHLAADQVEPTLDKVDQWIDQIYNSVAVNGLCLVIFSGSRESRSGLSFVEFRKVESINREQFLSE